MDPSPKLRRATVAAGALLAVASAHRTALAVNCTGDPTLTLPTPLIYAIGGSGPTPLIAKVATALSKANPPQTLIYASPGACDGVDAIINGTTIKGSVNYWDDTGTMQSCTITNLLGQPADLGVAGTYATYCPGITAVPSTVGDFKGPVQAYDFLVPSASTETAISAQAAYFVYGFGATSTYSVSPWLTEANIITRNNQSAAAIIIALGTNVPLATLNAQGTDGKSNGGTVTDLADLNSSQATAQTGIGFATAEVAEAAAANTINVLAYQHYGQSCGWLPNATPTTHEKINVRNGHYALWANIHFLAAVDSNNTPTNPNAANIIGYFEGTTPPPTGVDFDALTVQAGAILDCAMEVKRTTDMGPLEPYAPAAPCGCFFEFEATGATTCTACTSDASCPVNATHCRKGYCEVN
jgi:hypothetical protein